MLSGVEASLAPPGNYSLFPESPLLPTHRSGIVALSMSQADHPIVVLLDLPSDGSRGDEPRKVTFRFRSNLILMLLFGVAVSGWLLHYTDWFETVGGLLALGGLFSWLAFVSKMLPDSVLKDLQWKWVDFLESGLTAMAILVVALILVIVASFFGSVQIETRREGFANSLYIYRGGANAGEPLGLNSGKSTHFLKPATLFGGGEYRVKVPGLPSKLVRFQPWSLNTVYVPDSFARRVFLVRPSKDVVVDILNSPSKLHITIVRDGRTLVEAEIADYTGYSFWINCSADVAIPQNIQADLLDDLPNDAPEKYKALWLTPRAKLSWPDLDLQEKDSVKIRETPMPGRSQVVKDVDLDATLAKSYSDAVQIVVLERK
jgi:hypothetical protein